MPDTKISELTAAATLDGTEIVPVTQSGATVRTTAQEIADLGGGSAEAPIAGIPTLYTFDFAHDTSGLNDGVTVYTPAVGDVLLDFWFSVTEAWDGMNPAKVEVGTFVGTDAGLMAFNEGFGASVWPSLVTADDIDGKGAGMKVSYTFAGGLQAQHDQALYDNGSAWPYFVRFDATNPLKLVVSQDGEKGGDSPASATGEACLYLLIASPVSLNA